jgi:uncharacterized protein YbjT (DUF2867 family)
MVQGGIHVAERSPVLVVGGTGAVGQQVVSALLESGKRVRMLVRPASSAGDAEQRGVEVARGDMLDLASLVAAMEGVDAVITSAAGYTRRTPTDTAETDTVGNQNLVEAAAKAGIRRFVLTSILTCDQTPDVPHFWHKYLVEQHLQERSVPYVALRPGAFIETLTQFGGDPFAKGRVMYVGDAKTPFTLVWTADLARYLADAVDAPGVDGHHIDIGWDRPVSVKEIADIAGNLLGRRMRTTVIPGALLSGIAPIANRFNPSVKDMAAMFRWFQSGRYVADTSLQAEVFGRPPQAEDVIARYLLHLGHQIAQAH